MAALKEDFKADEYFETNEDMYISELSKQLKVKELAEVYNIDQVKLQKKIDLNVLPPFMLVYFIGYFCRSNLGILQIEGIFPSLKLTQIQFFSAYAAFFAPYIAFQCFLNLLLKAVRPHFWISITVLIYGALTLATGFVHNLGALVACQFLHGLSQAGTETALFYILAHYYPPREAQKRFSGVHSVSCIAGAVGMSVAYGVDKHLSGSRGLESWRWLLIIEGAMAICTAVPLFLTIPDFPENARFIDDDETSFLVKKLELFQGRSGYGLEVSVSEFTDMLLDPMVWIPAIASLGICYATYCYAFFEPVFVRQITGGSVADADAYSIYPWIASFFWVNIAAWASDRIGMRFPIFLICLSMAVAGGALCFSRPTVEVPDRMKYAGCFLVAMGSYSATPTLLCWTSLNLGGHSRKNLGITLNVSFASLGGLISIFCFMNNDARYTKGFTVGLIFLVVGLFLTIGYFFYLKAMNKRKRTTKYKAEFSQLSERKQIILGDKNPGFDYMY